MIAAAVCSTFAAVSEKCCRVIGKVDQLDRRRLQHLQQFPSRTRARALGQPLASSSLMSRKKTTESAASAATAFDIIGLFACSSSCLIPHSAAKCCSRRKMVAAGHHSAPLQICTGCLWGRISSAGNSTPTDGPVEQSQKSGNRGNNANNGNTGNNFALRSQS